jgi:hypothetical protein
MLASALVEWDLLCETMKMDLCCRFILRWSASVYFCHAKVVGYELNFINIDVFVFSCELNFLLSHQYLPSRLVCLT